MPPAESARTPDAILVPEARLAGLSGLSRLQEINRQFGPILGSARVAVSVWMGGPAETLFLRPEGFDPADSMQRFPSDGVHAGRDRYEWFVADQSDDGALSPVAPVLGLPGDENRIRLGYKVDPATLLAARSAEAEDPAYAAALLKAQADPAMRARMARAGLLPGTAPADAARAERAKKGGAA